MEVGWGDMEAAGETVPVLRRERFFLLCYSVAVANCCLLLGLLRLFKSFEGCRNGEMGLAYCIETNWRQLAVCDCGVCGFITLTRSRLIIIFAKLIISASVSVTVSMNYVHITLINQQNEF